MLQVVAGRKRGAAKPGLAAGERPQRQRQADSPQAPPSPCLVHGPCSPCNGRHRPPAGNTSPACPTPPFSRPPCGRRNAGVFFPVLIGQAVVKNLLDLPPAWDIIEAD